MSTLYHGIGFLLFWWFVAVLLWRLLLKPILIGFATAPQHPRPEPKPAKPATGQAQGLLAEMLRGKRG